VQYKKCKWSLKFVAEQNIKLILKMVLLSLVQFFT
jgi:hypothetical protein